MGTEVAVAGRHIEDGHESPEVAAARWEVHEALSAQGRYDGPEEEALSRRNEVVQWACDDGGR